MLDRLPAGGSYLGKMLLVAGIALLLPAATVVLLLFAGPPLGSGMLLVVVGLSWLIGLTVCWLGLGALLGPLEDTAEAFTRYVENRKLSDLDSGVDDLAGRLMANTRRGVRLLDEARRQTAIDRTTDPLTGLINRRSAFRRLGADLLRSSRDEKPVCVALIEIDTLEDLVQRLGHDSADVIAKTVSHVIVGEIRRSDWVASFGNNQFLVGLWGVDAPAAEVALKRVAEKLKSNAEFPITLSVGLIRAAESDRPDHVVADAANAMSQARNAGGNRVVVESRGAG